MKIPKELPAKQVTVYWDDAWADYDLSGTKEELLEKWPEAHLRCDTGFLVGKTADFVMLSLTADPPQRGAEAVVFTGITRIPRDMVRRIVPLCPSSPKRRSSSSSRSPSPQPSATPSASPPSPSPPSKPGAGARADVGQAVIRPEDHPLITGPFGVPVPVPRPLHSRPFSDFTDHLP